MQQSEILPQISKTLMYMMLNNLEMIVRQQMIIKKMIPIMIAIQQTSKKTKTISLNCRVELSTCF